MNCAEAKRFIALTREGELSQAEERALATHLRTCARCTAERAAFLNQDRSIEKLRSIIPELKDPDASLRAVLTRVRSESSPQRPGLLSALVDRLIGALEVPGLRYALAVFVTVMVTGFVIQQVTILRSVSALEARLSRPEAPRMRLAYAVDPGTVERLTHSQEIRTMLERTGAGQAFAAGRLGTARIGSLDDFFHSPESRWVLRTLLPETGERDIDSLVNELYRNVRFVLTSSKGDALR